MGKHFDGWGNPILGFAEMLAWYAGDGQSLSVIRRLPPFRYVVMPDVEIILDVDEPDRIEVRRIWPGGNVLKSHFVGKRVISVLRSLYSSPEAVWRHRRDGTKVIWKHSGRVIESAWSNLFGYR